MNSTLTGAVAIYLAQVRAELSDLPPGELEDVLDDVTSHLSEVAAELGVDPALSTLQERLGTPQQYADELRTAAGYPPRPTQPSTDNLKAADKALRWGLIGAIVGPFLAAIAILAWDSSVSPTLMVLGALAIVIAAFIGVQALRGQDPRVVLDTQRGARGAAAIRGWIDQLPVNVRHELVTTGQPVWWVARGMIGAGGFFALFGAPAVAVVGAIAGAAVSIWIGRRTQQDRRWLWYVVPLNVVAVVAVPAFLAAAYAGAVPTVNSPYGGGYRGSSNYNPPNDGLMLNGVPVTNLYPFDAQGKQVDVRLYDQDGNPIALDLQDCAANYRQVSRGTTSNLFPLAVVVPEENGGSSEETCKDTTKAPFVPPPAPATRTTPEPTAVPPSNPPSNPPGSSSTVKPSGGPTAKPSKPPVPTTGKPGATLTVEPTG